MGNMISVTPNIEVGTVRHTTISIYERLLATVDLRDTNYKSIILFIILLFLFGLNATIQFVAVDSLSRHFSN